MYDIKIHPHKLYFKQPAGTSRGTYVTRDVWYLSLIHISTMIIVKEQPGHGLGLYLTRLTDWLN